MKKNPPLLFALPLLLLINSVFVLFTQARPSSRGSSTSPTLQAGPILLKRTVAISTKRYLRYWPSPRAGEPQYNTRSWSLGVEFELPGPIAKDSELVFEVTVPDCIVQGRLGRPEWHQPVTAYLLNCLEFYDPLILVQS